MNWPLVISIIAGSALLAYLGDVLGSKYGKKRISLFGLRPKYTSRIITAFMGTVISVAVLSVVSVFSDSVSLALLNLQNLRDSLEEAEQGLTATRSELERTAYELAETSSALTETSFDLRMTLANLENLGKERDQLGAQIVSLREEYAETSKDLREIRQGTIAVQANSLLAQRFVPPGTPRAQVLEILDALRNEARADIVNKRSERFSTAMALREVRLTFDPMEESGAVARVTDFPERAYLRILAAENIAVNEEEVLGRLDSGASTLVYEKGAALYRKVVDPREQSFNAEEALHVFLRELKLQAIRYGVLPDPATNNVGSLEGEEFFNVVENLKSITTVSIINAFALEDIYTEGPVRITIMLE